MKLLSYIVILFVLNSVTLNSQTNNIGFELTAAGNYTAANAVSGWTLQSASNTWSTGSCSSSITTIWNQPNSEFWIRQTPIFGHPYIGFISNSPLGGTNIAQLNNTGAGSLMTRLRSTFLVTNTNSAFMYAFCGSWDGGSHTCCDQPHFKINFLDALGNPTCFTEEFKPSGPSCITGVSGYSITNNVSWTSWKTKLIDLSYMMGNLVTVEVISADCGNSGHHGSLYFDAITGSNCTFFQNNGVSIFLPPYGPQQTVNFCAGSNQASMCGPLGYATYSWSAPNSAPPISVSQRSLSCLTIANPIPGQTYTLQMSTASGCVFVATYVLAFSTVNIAALGASPSCSMGTSGSAYVIANGSGTGYNYVWRNSSNSVIATSSVVNNLSPGVYSIVVTALGSAACGTAVATTTVASISPPLITATKLFCGSEAYLQVPPGANSVQWYNGLSAISPSVGGTIPSWTVTSPVNGGIYRVRYLTVQGCIDSAEYTLMSTPPGSLNLASVSGVCLGAGNGSAVAVISPAAGMPFSNGSYSVFSVGVTPPYSASLSPTSSNSYTATGLSAGTYSVKAFDGSCKYGIGFSVSPYLLDYTVNSAGPTTLCPGNFKTASVTFTGAPLPGQYTYSWSPNIFLSGNVNTVPNTIISPTTGVGTQTTIVYTVVVSPTVAYCPMSKTLSIHVTHPASPTISPIPNFCPDLPFYTITALPSGGTFAWLTGLGQNGVITMSLTSLGLNTVTYTKPFAGCNGVSSSTFVLYQRPVLAAVGNNSICIGETATITVSGANTYSWNNGSNLSSIVVSPSATTIYSLSATGVNGCSNTATVLLPVIYYPTLATTDPTICTNQISKIVASGANSYTWSTGLVSPTLTLNSSQVGTYTLTGINYPHCISTKTILVSAVPSLTVTLPPDIQFCSGNTLTITANGGLTYTWNTGATSASISISPLITTTYNVIGENSFGCKHNTAVVANVIPSPTLSVVGNEPLCRGYATALYADGASNLVWENSVVGTKYLVSPNVTTTYILKGWSANGCVSILPVTLVVIDCTSMNELSDSAFLKIFPNPTSGKFRVENNLASHFILYDQMGKIVLEEDLQEGTQEFDAAELDKGIYFIVLSNSEGSKSLKLVKLGF